MLAVETRAESRDWKSMRPPCRSPEAAWSSFRRLELDSMFLEALNKLLAGGGAAAAVLHTVR